MSKIRRGEKLVAPGKLILGETGEQGGQKEENDITGTSVKLQQAGCCSQTSQGLTAIAGVSHTSHKDEPGGSHHRKVTDVPPVQLCASLIQETDMTNHR
jgi:hypothetical protein